MPKSRNDIFLVTGRAGAYFLMAVSGVLAGFGLTQSLPLFPLCDALIAPSPHFAAAVVVVTLVWAYRRKLTLTASGLFAMAAMMTLSAAWVLAYPFTIMAVAVGSRVMDCWAWAILVFVLVMIVWRGYRRSERADFASLPARAVIASLITGCATLGAIQAGPAYFGRFDASCGCGCIVLGAIIILPIALTGSVVLWFAMRLLRKSFLSATPTLVLIVVPIISALVMNDVYERNQAEAIMGHARPVELSGPTGAMPFGTGRCAQ